MKLFLYQSPNGYCYNSDSIFLYALAREFKIEGSVLDIGCGVGILTLLLAKEFQANYYIIEKQQEMYNYACRNFKINGFNVDANLGTLQEYKPNLKFDFIISNPPFYKVDSNQSLNISKNIARYEHHLPLKILIEKSSKLLKNRGYLIFCYDAWQSDDIFLELKNHSLQPEFVKFIHSKANKEAKTIMIVARKGSKAKSKILPPLIVFNEKKEYMPEAKEAFIRANTHSIKAICD